ncbi:MAG: hypothetical protein PHG54_14635 [Smithellaceae bacterium]|nr:hypothetical protein [Smithellaceae bacterium]NLX51495.1 hypothetical protein [Deltaproteobacteria bacterium]
MNSLYAELILFVVIALIIAVVALVVRSGKKPDSEAGGIAKDADKSDDVAAGFAKDNKRKKK